MLCAECISYLSAQTTIASSRQNHYHMNRNQLKKKFLKYNFTVRNLCEKSKLLLPFYQKVFLPFHAFTFSAGNYKIGRLISAKYVRALQNDLVSYLPDADFHSSKRKKVERDIVKSYFSCNVFPDEYFLYDFPHLGYWERRSYLSDTDRLDILQSVYDEETLKYTRNKYLFYQLAKEYFHRDVCLISHDQPEEEFLVFTSRHLKFIAKPLRGQTGVDATILSVSDAEEAKKIRNQLLEKDDWIIEELIIQHPEMAKWNETSVNTVRLPSFRTSHGEFILRPIFRAGRKGSIVDNSGQGGLKASIDTETGVLISEGVDEFGGRFACHPDNGIQFIGWQIPHWDELKALVAKIHSSLPEVSHYVGFDMALTKEGQWVLVEGNSLAQLGGQYAERRGAREEFIKYFNDRPRK